MNSKKHLTLAVCLALAAVAHAETRRDIKIEEIPANISDSVKLDLNVADGRDSVKIGERIAFCFTASADGYISLWDFGTSRKVRKLFPYPKDDAVRAAKPGKEECVGNQRFTVDGPAGTENVVLLWTKNADAQIEADGFDDAKAFSARLERKTKDIIDTGAGDEGWDAWATANVTFEILNKDGNSDDGTSTEISTGGIAQTNNNYTNVFVIAFGSNVGDLRLTNEDANRFAQTAKASYNIPDENIRVVENARRTDFEKSFAWVKDKAGENDLVLFYYSGHGTHIPDDNGDEADERDEAIVPYDLADEDNWNNADKYIRDDQLKAWIDDIPAGAVVTFFDSCFSGGMFKDFSQSGLLNGRPKFFNQGKIAGKQPQYRGKALKGSKDLRDIGISDGLENGTSGKTKYAMLAASQEFEYAIEAPNQGGMFTLGLYDTLKDPGSAKNWEEMSSNVSRSVLRSTGGRQTPVTEDPDGLLKDLKL